MVGTALVVIDVQKGILEVPGARRPMVLERFNAVRKRIARLVEEARGTQSPIIFIQHDGPPGHRLAVGTPGWAICEDLNQAPDDRVIRKTACDSFYETDLQSVLSEGKISRLVIAGLMTQYCVDTTCRRAVGLGYDVTLVADAHTTADSEGLTVEQIVTHHNSVLDGFSAGPASVTVVPASDIYQGQTPRVGGEVA